MEQAGCDEPWREITMSPRLAQDKNGLLVNR